MIHVSHLTKNYPGRTAVNDVSFEVGRGEIVGFLGPNGAGKTTTMRILAGYIAATGGTVRVAGFDVANHPLEVRRRIGYLPENCPLYPDMRVDEYLVFRARLKGVPARHVRSRLAEVKNLCGIGDVGRRIIGQLSKGYRQRVGLAESLIHDPELLILDEPTIGLDPNQIRLVRQLIADLAKRHTILLSTHILPEVEMTCQRVLILHQGRIVASDSPDRLRRRLEGGHVVRAELQAPEVELAEALCGLPGVEKVDLTALPGRWQSCELRLAAGSDPRVELAALAARRGWALRELRAEEASLEDIFVSLTRNEEVGSKP